MKKMLVLVLFLALLPVASWAEEAELPLFRLTTTEESGQERTLGSAVLVGNSSLMLTSRAALGDAAELTADGPDGVYPVSQVLPMGQESELVMLILEASSGLTPALLTEQVDGTASLEGWTVNGLRYETPALSVTSTVYQGLEAWLVSATEPLLPGAALFQDGALAGLVVATWGEGENRYLALSGETLAQLLFSAENEAADSASYLQDVALNYEGGMLTVDWSAADLSGHDEGSIITVYVADPANPYYAYYQAEPGENALQVAAVPGRTYRVWVLCAAEESATDVSLPEDLAVSARIPDGGTYTEHGFTSECYLAAGPAENADWTAPLPALDPVTAESLMEGELFLQVINTYQVEEEMEAAMLLTLFTPEGYAFYMASGYLFSPDYMTNDVWNADVTELFEDYLTYNGTGAFMPGEYRLQYTIGDAWGDAFSFTLE